MRSYYAHLETATNVPKGAVSPKPVFRSSAIFPVLQQPGISSRILFLGYWILKRNIHEIACVITLRDLEGTILNRHTLVIAEAKTYRIEVSDQLTACGLPRETNFQGSLEVEFYSTQNLVFPYPAVVINYYGPNFCSVVHTAQRVYNDFDDMNKNSQTAVPESGFNIYADKDREPFLGLINGSLAVPEGKLNLQIFNSENQMLSHEVAMGPMVPYETRIIYLGREMALQDFLHGKPGTGKAYFQLNWIFPRLLIGNIDHSLPAITLTHSYYDCSNAKSDSDYWRPSEAGWYPASLMLPVSIRNSHFTNIDFYPIYSPAKFAIDLEIYNAKGEKLGRKENILEVDSSKPKWQTLPMKTICEQMGITSDQDLGVRLIARNIEGNRIPTRIKIALDIGGTPQLMPCNICTNLQPFNPAVEGKPKSFRWAPVLADQPNAFVWLMNSSPATEYHRAADIELTFFRESDSTTIIRYLQLAPHGFHVIHLNQDEELKNFFQNTVGWMTATTTNPYTVTYYFAENSSGMIGGDHGF